MGSVKQCLRRVGVLGRSTSGGRVFDGTSGLRSVELCARSGVMTRSSTTSLGTAAGEGQQHEEGTTSSSLLSVAPMMEWTDVHYRTLARLMTRRTLLYTEMIVDKTLVFQDKAGNSLDRYLHFPELQHPVVLQLGGNKASELEAAVNLAVAYGYDEINLNCGCPSPRVSGKGCFGAALMKEPSTVREIVESMARASPVPVTVKCRLGVDDNDTYPELVEFVKRTSEGLPIHHYVIHARKAFLKGLSPAQNRNVPPLKYDWVYQLSQDFPHLQFSLNGGVQNLEEARELLDRRGEAGGRLHGVMIGRAAYQRPWHTLSDADRAIYGESENPCTSRRQLLTAYSQLCDGKIEAYSKAFGCKPGQVIRKMVKPLLGMFYAEPGTSKWKKSLESMLQSGSAKSVGEIVLKGMVHIPEEILDASPQAKLVHETRTDDEGNKKRVFSMVE
ncbi:tRNA-dihydrouridine synthase [Chloropicon primus]|uniref:tRNA-dihydrouridine synthase n=1 Tax=Chloropicon primus TaxID=1764295 RepID=A0A5B8MHN9_9CHLO|nr:tRNA-dihydrouridine synthase [Chloropicon primus]UPQ98089.1 tRNA-dihydrouridine synthase [Chloropicon primus]|eukprot:QDZ18882.1 tRNA-dihydrouridine synthase [Chloropicon primus]